MRKNICRSAISVITLSALLAGCGREAATQTLINVSYDPTREFYAAKLSPSEFIGAVTRERVVSSYKVSFLTSFLAALVNAVMGTVIAWVLARYEFPFKRLMDGLIELPFALPTAVAGIALTHLCVEDGWIGAFSQKFGIQVAYTKFGIIIALIFIGIPFVVRSVQPVLEKLEPDYEEAASMMGAARFQTFLSVICFQGQVEAGSIKVGDEITTLPSNEKAHVKSIHILDKETVSAEEGQPATIQLDREVDVSRGCVLTVGANLKTASSVEATLLWMDDAELEEGKNFFVKLGTKQIPGTVTEIVHTIDVNTGEQKKVQTLHKNEIAVCRLTFADQIVVDLFAQHKTLGELILIDRVTNMTSACGVITGIEDNDDSLVNTKLDREARSSLKGQRSVTVEFPIGKHGITLELVEKAEKLLSIE